MINLTESAVKHIKRFREDENTPDGGLRVAVVGGGCSGMSYKLEFQRRINIQNMARRLAFNIIYYI